MNSVAIAIEKQDFPGTWMPQNAPGQRGHFPASRFQSPISTPANGGADADDEAPFSRYPELCPAIMSN